MLSKEEFFGLVGFQRELKQLFISKFSTLDTQIQNVNKFLLTNIMLNDNFKYTKPEIQKAVRGYACEMLLEVLLQKYIIDVKKRDNKNCYLLTNLLIPTNADNKNKPIATQIDAIFITPKTVICIECKSVFGIINIDGGIITATSNNNTTALKPWSQNMSHIMALKDIFDSNNMFVYINNGVFLYSLGEIKQCSLEKDNIILIPNNVYNVIDFLDRTSGKPTQYNTEAIYSILKKYKPTPELEYQHIQNLNSIYKN